MIFTGIAPSSGQYINLTAEMFYENKLQLLMFKE